jgi:glycerol-3-phosphate dehydrogenase
LIGTSDIAVDDPDAVRCTEEEVDYFLDLVRRVFPTIRVRRSEIVFRFSGVRPLAFSKFMATGQITRDHEILASEPATSKLPFPVLSLVGGKWTSWRAFSEQAADRCLGILERKRSIETRRVAIGGGRGYPADADSRNQVIDRLAVRCGGSRERAQTLFERYGTRADRVAEFIGAGADAALAANPDYSRRELEFIGVNEKLIYLDDLLLRRSMLAMLGHVTRATLREAADALADILQWDGTRVEAEVARCAKILQDRHQIDL